MACNARMCGPCDRVMEQRDALSWCNTCGEGLCQNCIKEHKKNRASSNHEVILVEDLCTEFQTFLSFEDQCDTHIGKSVTLYCISHDKLCCASCLRANHRKCTDIVSVEDVANSTIQSTELEDLEARIEDINHILNIILIKKNENITGLKTQAKKYETAILRMKKRIMSHIDEAEMAAKKEMKNKEEYCIRNLLMETDYIKKKQSDLIALQRDLKALKKCGHDKHLFISMKRLSVVQFNLEQELQKSRDTLFKRYKLQRPPNSSTSNLIASIYKETKIELSPLEGVPELKKYQQCQIVLPTGQSLKLMDTVNPNNIFLGSTVWKLCYFDLHDKVAIPDGGTQLYVYDIQNKSVGTIDLNPLRNTWYIDKFDENHALVALLHETSLFKINVVDLKTIDRVDLGWDQNCITQAICVIGHIVFRDNQTQCFVIFKKGRFLRKIPNPCDTHECYICGYEDNKIIYSDFYSRTVGCVSLEGQQIFSLKLDDSPTGIAVDRNNFIYVGTYGSGIQKITPGGKIVTNVLLYDRLIRGMTYKKSTHELIILADGLQFYKIT